MIRVFPADDTREIFEPASPFVPDDVFFVVFVVGRLVVPFF
ncbi:hypothetical protein [Leptospirillum ferriphilum]|nr:hypothetical protein [Leptospirillum ferriphilum]